MTAGDIMRYCVWAVIIALGGGIAVLEGKLTRWRLVWILFPIMAVTGYAITEASPFTFSGGDHYLDGVILIAFAGLLSIGYLATVLALGAARMFGGKSK